MILDGHLHIFGLTGRRDELLQRLDAAGVAGGTVLSLPPQTFETMWPSKPAAERLDNLFGWCDSQPNLFPFFWIDPLEPDALEQVDLAVERGVMGFKVICDHYYPGDPQALAVFRKIAEQDRPILFHSGILWDGKPSSMYNRPVGFEVLLDIDNLRLALAHVGWPWCDEMIAVYGKFQSARRHRTDVTAEMFIDLTPGTPPIYRREALTKLLTVGYDIERNLIFGTDCSADDYSAEKTRDWITRDTAIYRELGCADETIERIFSGNLQRFLGTGPDTISDKRA